MRISKIIIALMFIQGAFADVIPKDPKAGDRYIKVTKVEKKEKFCNMPKKKYTLVRFEVCEIDKIEKDVDNKDVIIDRICRPVNGGSERTLYSLQRLNKLHKKMVSSSQINMFVGLFTLCLTCGDAVDKHVMGKALRREITQDKEVTFYDQGTISYDEEKVLEKNPKNEVSYFDYFLEGMQGALKTYDKDYKKICDIEKDPAPVLPVDVPSFATDDSSHEELSFGVTGHVACKLK